MNRRNTNPSDHAEWLRQVNQAERAICNMPATDLMDREPLESVLAEQRAAGKTPKQAAWVIFRIVDKED